MKNKYYSIKDNFLAIEEEFSNYNDSGIVILPAPYEQTTSYGKGTAKGPKAILNASHYVEFFDEELDRELCFEEGNGICSLLPLDFKKKKVWNESSDGFVGIVKPVTRSDWRLSARNSTDTSG